MNDRYWKQAEVEAASIRIMEIAAGSPDQIGCWHATVCHPGGTTALDMPALAARFEKLAALRDGWDSYGAPRIDRDLRDPVLWCALVLSPGRGQPALVPLSSGGVQLEWPDGTEVEVRPDGTIVAWCQDEAFDGPRWGGR